MYSRCIRCDRPFPKNTEIANLRVGRRIAFDASRGRLWIVCTHCEQWNLVPLEERWEAVEQSERLAANAEAAATAASVGIAQTSSGLELIRVGGLSKNDIANWRYGRRLVQRQRLLAWIAVSFAVLAMVLGARAGVAAGSAGIGVYVSVVALVWFGFVWKDPPRLSTLVVRLGSGRLWIWPWQIRDIFIDSSNSNLGPQLVISGRRPCRFSGLDAAQILARLLPKLNGAECATASVRAALAKVARAEREERGHIASVGRKRRRKESERREEASILRPWERLASSKERLVLDRMAPEDRLALEMAVTEEIEQRYLIHDAESAGSDWNEQEAIAGIADSLLVSPEVEDRLQRLKEGSRSDSSAPPSNPGPSNKAV